ncbi:MAG: sterol desaturase family protein [Flavobacteriales bacterium]|nr:sterol desaturase family protein [Flavobacteriales bacterium]
MFETIQRAYVNFGSYMWDQITFQSGTIWGNYFWMLVIVSLIFFGFEIMRPWRTRQPRFRKDFWLDFFYMFFNFFLFNLLIYNAASDVVVNWFNKGIMFLSGVDLQALNPMRSWPLWGILLTGFIVRDFVQWWTHRLLHRVPALWEFHKVHHSVEEMGFAAHLRYHWMETIVYRSIEYIPLALLGIGLHDFFLIHLFTLVWGHYNHANLTIGPRITGGLVFGLLAFLIVNTGTDLDAAMQTIVSMVAIAVGALVGKAVMPRLFNSPEMHIWHHAYDLPASHPHGINFGLTLGIWDYIFGTAVIPHNGRDIRLGFPGMERFPHSFGKQFIFGFGKEKK